MTTNLPVQKRTHQGDVCLLTSIPFCKPPRAETYTLRRHVSTHYHSFLHHPCSGPEIEQLHSARQSQNRWVSVCKYVVSPPWRACRGRRWAWGTWLVPTVPYTVPCGYARAPGTSGGRTKIGRVLYESVFRVFLLLLVFLMYRLLYAMNV